MRRGGQARIESVRAIQGFISYKHPLPGMLSRRMNKWLTATALYFASASISALAVVYELPADGSALVGTDSRIRLSDQEKLFDVARRYGLGYPEIVRANPGADIWLPGEG